MLEFRLLSLYTFIFVLSASEAYCNSLENQTYGDIFFIDEASGSVYSYCGTQNTSRVINVLSAREYQRDSFDVNIYSEEIFKHFKFDCNKNISHEFIKFIEESFLYKKDKGNNVLFEDFNLSFFKVKNVKSYFVFSVKFNKGLLQSLDFYEFYDNSFRRFYRTKSIVSFSQMPNLDFLRSSLESFKSVLDKKTLEYGYSTKIYVSKNVDEKYIILLDKILKNKFNDFLLYPIDINNKYLIYSFYSMNNKNIDLFDLLKKVFDKKNVSQKSDGFWVD